MRVVSPARVMASGTAPDNGRETAANVAGWFQLPINCKGRCSVTVFIRTPYCLFWVVFFSFFWIRFLLLSFLSSLSRYSGNLDGGFICATLTGRAGITLLYVIGVPSNGRNSDPPNLKPARLKGFYLTTALSWKQSKPSAHGDVSLEMLPGRVG